MFAADRAGRTTDPRPECLGPLETRDHPFPDHVPLELSKHGEHPEHDPAGGRGRVDCLIKYDEVDTERPELPAEDDQVRERTGQAIELGAHDDVDLAPARNLHARRGRGGVPWHRSRHGPRTRGAPTLGPGSTSGAVPLARPDPDRRWRRARRSRRSRAAPRWPDKGAIIRRTVSCVSVLSPTWL